MASVVVFFLPEPWEILMCCSKLSTSNELALRKRKWRVLVGGICSREEKGMLTLYFLFHLNNGQPINDGSLKRNLRSLQIEEWLYHK
jgi:hypothetical protein